MTEAEIKLYGRVLCPHARLIQLGLLEKHIPFSFEKTMSDWTDSTLPIIRTAKDEILSGVYSILEYLEENYATAHLLGKDVSQRGETRRLLQWCNEVLLNNITRPFVFERVHRMIFGLGVPKFRELGFARQDMVSCLSFAEELLTERSWFAGEDFSWADLSLAAHISCLDYLGEIDWSRLDALYGWYMILKSRRSMQVVFEEKVPGIGPARYYKQADFDRTAGKK